MRIERLIVDANWGKSTEIVYQFCRESQWGAILMPGHGRYIGASSVGLTDKAPQRGDRRGLNWVIPARGNRGRRHIVYDTNYWKSYVHARLSTARGDPGALTLWGRNPDDHRMIAEHITAEYYVRTEGLGRTVDEWKLRPEKPDNDFLDCLVGAAVAASEQGCVLAGMTPPPSRPKRRRVKFSDLQKQRKAVYA